MIVPEAIEQGKSVLISSSENAIRGLMMHLCDIPAEQIVGVEIPTGACVRARALPVFLSLARARTRRSPRLRRSA